MKANLVKAIKVLTGQHTGLRGDLDSCEIVSTDRMRGINISELVKGD